MNVIDQMYALACTYDGTTRIVYSGGPYTIDWRPFEHGVSNKSCILILRKYGTMSIRLEHNGYKYGPLLDWRPGEFFCSLSSTEPLEHANYFYNQSDSGTVSLDTEEEIFQNSVLCDVEQLLPIWQTARRIESHPAFKYCRIMGFDADVNLVLPGLDDI